MRNGIRVVITILIIPAFIVIGLYLFSRTIHKFKPITIHAAEIIQPASAQTLKKLRLGAYNIAHARGGEYKASNFQDHTRSELIAHLDEIADLISRENLDIVVLNEVDFRSAWSHHINVAEYIMDKGGFNWRLEQLNTNITLPFHSFRYGNAILSKFPITKAEFINYPATSSIQDIFMGSHDGVYCEIMTPQGSMGILPIHLDNKSEFTRVESIKTMMDHIEHVDLPVLAFGDFNSTISNLPRYKQSRGGQNAMEYLMGHGQFVSYIDNNLAAESFTFPSQKPDRIIDWITGRNIHGFFNSKTVASDLSDHFMITSEVVLHDLYPTQI